MKITKNSITHLASEGRITLQVPELYFNENSPEMIDAPNEWFCYIKYDKSPCIGKQKGVLYLTEKGFNDNYDDIKSAFENALVSGQDRTNGIGWPFFCSTCE